PPPPHPPLLPPGRPRADGPACGAPDCRLSTRMQPLTTRWVRHCLLASTFALSLGTGPATAETVQRCESPDRKVTYSNTTCPEGTTSTRKVNTSSPVARE